jgi:glycosyltransferase involved in cell wall biosynthesis
LIKVFSKLVVKYPELRLIKVGTPEYLQQYDELQFLIQELDLENFVIFVDHPPEEDLVAFYNLADIFVYPSMYEGFGMPPLEAMACGTPVVCSNAASLPEVVGDAAVTLDPDDTQVWVAAIERVLNDTALQSDLRERGLKRARQFTWERTAQKTLEVYQELFPFG